MCMVDLNKEELQAGIINLEARLHDLQRNAGLHNYYDCTLTDTSTLLGKMRKALGEYNANDN